MKTLGLALMIFLFVAPTLAQAATSSETQEVTYDDLVSELASRKKKLTVHEVNPLDEVKIHAGFGMINSFSAFEIAGQKISRYENGMQLSAGVDLFSPNWYAEAAWRNFGLTRNGNEAHSLRELDLKFGHKGVLNSAWTYHLETGLANRSLHLTDETRGIDVSDTTPDLLGAGGADLQISPILSLEIATALHTPVVGQTADRGSWDFGLTMKVSL